MWSWIGSGALPMNLERWSSRAAANTASPSPPVISDPIHDISWIRLSTAPHHVGKPVSKGRSSVVVAVLHPAYQYPWIRSDIRVLLGGVHPDAFLDVLVRLVGDPLLAQGVEYLLSVPASAGFRVAAHVLQDVEDELSLLAGQLDDDLAALLQLFLNPVERVVQLGHRVGAEGLVRVQHQISPLSAARRARRSAFDCSGYRYRVPPTPPAS